MKGLNSFVGIIPAAGSGSRLGNIGHSKELLKLGSDSEENEGGKVVSSYLLDHYHNAGVSDVHFIIREDKKDIQDYYGRHPKAGMKLFYHFTKVNAGVPFSIHTAYPDYKNKNVVFGFPDILFYPADSCSRMMMLLDSDHSIDVVLGLFPVSDPKKWDTVELDGKGEVRKIWIKEAPVNPVGFVWILAAWKPGFSDFIRDKVEQYSASTGLAGEVYMGHIIQQAIDEGLRVVGCPFNKGGCLDVGTPEGLARASSFIGDHF